MRMSGKSLRRSEDGAALVEFAIVLPVLLLLVFGIIDFGRALSVKNGIIAAVHDGARLAAVQYPDVNRQAVQESVKRFLAPLGIEPTVVVSENRVNGTLGHGRRTILVHADHSVGGERDQSVDDPHFGVGHLSVGVRPLDDGLLARRCSDSRTSRFPGGAPWRNGATTSSLSRLS